MVVFAATAQLVSRELRVAPAVRSSWDRVVAFAMVSLLWFLGLYYLCLLLALGFVWLGAVDMGVIQAVALRRNACETAFTVCMFAFTLAALASADRCGPAVGSESAL